jgi:hypothetical protein
MMMLVGSLDALYDDKLSNVVAKLPWRGCAIEALR